LFIHELFSRSTNTIFFDIINGNILQLKAFSHALVVNIFAIIALKNANISREK